MEATKMIETEILEEASEEVEVTFKFKCHECQMSFSNVDVEEHMQEYHPGKEMEIENEELGYEEVIEEEDDVLSDIGMAFVIKNAEGMFECSECFQTYKSLNRFLTHVKTHGTVTDENVKKLEEYLLKFNESEKMYDEYPNEEDSSKVTYRCRVCHTEFDTRKKVLLHFPIHRNVSAAHKKNRNVIEANDQSLHCKLCNRSLKNDYELKMHMTAHAENSAYSSKPTRNDVKLQPTPPKKKKDADGKSTYPCQYCEKEFKRPHEKVKHERIHTGEKPYGCDICGKQFRVTYCLSLHKKNVHSDFRPFVCSFENCNKRFKSQSVYNHHLNTHGTAKNYKCPFCEKSFKTSVQLAGHKNTHTKPFSCTVCSRAFASLYAVKIHMEIHRNGSSDTNNLKYVCKICSAQYGRSFALTDHLKTAHPGMANEAVEIETDEHYIIEDSDTTVIEEDREVYSVVMIEKE